ncbi:LegC family aminotransferase [Gallibacter sp. Marseille-QA0791]|uniref:LegC family aminotransferase n=1 Tax=Gallibacter sp. Marseille-QA0791 TaxID=3378781 RepID=UPI003D0EB8E0
MSREFIPLSVPNIKGNELKYITEAIKTEWVSTGGSFINDFERRTTEYVKSVGAVACQSGTAGIHLALVANGIGADDTVIVPALTFIAAVNPVSYVGAEPVFMDCDDSLCMDMDKVEGFCEEQCIFSDGKLVNKATGRQVKAMIVVHVFGNMADMEKAVDIANKYNLILVEDATEALGSYINKGKFEGKYAGTIGNVGIYSYNGNKIITTGGGGMVVSNDDKLLERIRYLSTQAKDDPLYYIHDNIGYNYRMTNLQAAVGLGQMEKLEDFIKIKEKNYRMYSDLGIDLIKFRDNTRPNYWFYSYITEHRDKLIEYLDSVGIQTRPIWNLICDLKPYRKCIKYKIEKAKQYWNEVVNIPCSTNLHESDLERVASEIKKFERTANGY